MIVVMTTVKMCLYLSEQVTSLAQSATALRPETTWLSNRSRVYGNHSEGDASNAISQYHRNSFLCTQQVSVNLQHYVT